MNILTKVFGKKDTILGIPTLSIIGILLTFVILFLIIRILRIYEKKKINEIKNKDEKKQKNSIFNVFISQRAVLPLTIGVLLSLRLRTFINILTDTLVNPIFNLDYNADGLSDITQLSELFNITIFGLEYKFGIIFLETIKITIFMIITYFFILIVYFNTNLINLEFN